MVHEQIAAGLLKGVQARAADRGVTLDIGEIPNAAPASESGDNDPYRLHRVTAHAIARVGDRFTVIRKISRHFEGQDKRSGLLSDIAAAAWELYKRNPETLQSLGRSLAGDIQKRQAERSANGKPNQHGG